MKTVQRILAALLAAAMLLFCAVSYAEEAETTPQRTDFAARAEKVLSLIAQGEAARLAVSSGGETASIHAQGENDGTALAIQTEGTRSDIRALLSLDTASLLCESEGQVLGLRLADWMSYIQSFTAPAAAPSLSVDDRALAALMAKLSRYIVTTDGRTTVIRITGRELARMGDEFLGSVFGGELGEELPALILQILQANGLELTSDEVIEALKGTSLADSIPQEYADAILLLTVSGSRDGTGTNTVVDAMLTFQGESAVFHLNSHFGRTAMGLGRSGNATLIWPGMPELNLDYTLQDGNIDATLKWVRDYGELHELYLKGCVGDVTSLTLTHNYGEVYASLTADLHSETPSCTLTLISSDGYGDVETSLTCSATFGRDRQTLDVRVTEDWTGTTALSVIVDNENGVPCALDMQLHDSDPWSDITDMTVTWKGSRAVITVDGQKTELTWSDDQNGTLTLVALVDTARYVAPDGEGEPALEYVPVATTFTLTANDGDAPSIILTALQDEAGELFSAELNACEKVEFAPIDESSALFITPEMLMSMANAN